MKLEICKKFFLKFKLLTKIIDLRRLVFRVQLLLMDSSISYGFNLDLDLGIFCVINCCNQAINPTWLIL